MAPNSVLTDAEKEHFVAHGWVKIPKAFTREQADEFTKDVWTRLGMDPNDQSTWSRERTNMPSHTGYDCSEFAPRAWQAICEVCGGEERVTGGSKQWRDSLIVNLGTPQNAGKPEEGKRLYGWHVDGDFFVHYLDSPEQGLLVIPLFTDIVPGGGGTYICPEALPKVAQWLHDNPDGVSPRMMPRSHPEFGNEKPQNWFNNTAHSCDNFVEATGECGDVYLLHPLMLHTASTNPLRRVRIITNPPVSLRQPFVFDRSSLNGGGGDYSLVEKATLRALGKDSLPGWSITAPREKVVPNRLKVQEEMKRKELERLDKLRGVSAAA